jgi:putative Holliday junction resolvase
VRPLGIDLGTRRIGVAVADSAGRLATAYEVVVRSGDTARDHRRIAELAAEVEADRLVVGLPLSLDGSDSDQTRAARSFADRLAGSVDVPVELYDERFTTSLALQAGGTSSLDSRAAATLLDEWLRLPIREENPPQP